MDSSEGEAWTAAAYVGGGGGGASVWQDASHVGGGGGGASVWQDASQVGGFAASGTLLAWAGSGETVAFDFLLLLLERGDAGMRGAAVISGARDASALGR